MRRFHLVVLALAGWLVTAAAYAHTRSESHSAWTVNGSRVNVLYSIPNIELRKLTSNGSLPSVAAWHAYVVRNLWVSVADSRCPLAAPPRPLAADAVFQRVELSFVCPRPQPMILHATTFIDVAPKHMHFAQIEQGADFAEQLFTKEQRTLDLSASKDGPLADASFFTYVRMGIEHILTGGDHMSFLVGLVLLARRLRDLLFVVTGFTLGHSLTLALAVTGIVRPHAEYIDALVALTILLVGAENAAVATRRPVAVSAVIIALLAVVGFMEAFGFVGLPIGILIGAGLFSSCYLMISTTLGDAGRLRLFVTLIFGLIHGFGFAAGLLEMEIPKDKLFELLFGFNLGVEFGQVAIVLSLVGIAALLGRLRWAPPRSFVVDTAAALLAVFGTYWFISRSISLV